MQRGVSEIGLLMILAVATIGSFVLSNQTTRQQLTRSLAAVQVDTQTSPTPRGTQSPTTVRFRLSGSGCSAKCVTDPASSLSLSDCTAQASFERNKQTCIQQTPSPTQTPSSGIQNIGDETPPLPSASLCVSAGYRCIGDVSEYCTAAGLNPIMRSTCTHGCSTNGRCKVSATVVSSASGIKWRLDTTLRRCSVDPSGPYSSYEQCFAKLFTLPTAPPRPTATPSPLKYNYDSCSKASECISNKCGRDSLSGEQVCLPGTVSCQEVSYKVKIVNVPVGDRITNSDFQCVVCNPDKSLSLVSSRPCPGQCVRDGEPAIMGFAASCCSENPVVFGELNYCSSGGAIANGGRCTSSSECISKNCLFDSLDKEKFCAPAANSLTCNGRDYQNNTIEMMTGDNVTGSDGNCYLCYEGQLSSGGGVCPGFCVPNGSNLKPGLKCCSLNTHLDETNAVVCGLSICQSKNAQECTRDPKCSYGNLGCTENGVINDYDTLLQVQSLIRLCAQSGGTNNSSACQQLSSRIGKPLSSDMLACISAVDTNSQSFEVFGFTNEGLKCRDLFGIQTSASYPVCTGAIESQCTSLPYCEWRRLYEAVEPQSPDVPQYCTSKIVGAYEPATNCTCKAKISNAGSIYDALVNLYEVVPVENIPQMCIPEGNSCVMSSDIGRYSVMNASSFDPNVQAAILLARSLQERYGVEVYFSSTINLSDVQNLKKYLEIMAASNMLSGLREALSEGFRIVLFAMPRPEYLLTGYVYRGENTDTIYISNQQFHLKDIVETYIHETTHMLIEHNVIVDSHYCGSNSECDFLDAIVVATIADGHPVYGEDFPDANSYTDSAIEIPAYMSEEYYARPEELLNERPCTYLLFADGNSPFNGVQYDQGAIASPEVSRARIQEAQERCTVY